MGTMCSCLRNRDNNTNNYFYRFKTNSLSLLYLIFPNDSGYLNRIKNKKSRQCISKINFINKVEERTITIKNIFCLVKLNNTEIASGSDNTYTIKIWNLQTGTCKRNLTGHTHHVWFLVRLDKTLLASGCQDGSIKIWDYTRGSCLRTFEALSDNSDDLYSLIKLSGLLIINEDEEFQLRVETNSK